MLLVLPRCWSTPHFYTSTLIQGKLRIHKRRNVQAVWGSPGQGQGQAALPAMQPLVNTINSCFAWKFACSFQWKCKMLVVQPGAQFLLYLQE
eukprot:1157563-Pelagomonas_calceolata.AAC.5